MVQTDLGASLSKYKEDSVVDPVSTCLAFCFTVESICFSSLFSLEHPRDRFVLQDLPTSISLFELFLGSLLFHIGGLRARWNTLVRLGFNLLEIPSSHWMLA